jgi:hypothetical protein
VRLKLRWPAFLACFVVALAYNLLIFFEAVRSSNAYESARDITFGDPRVTLVVWTLGITSVLYVVVVSCFFPVPRESA